MDTIRMIIQQGAFTSFDSLINDTIRIKYTFKEAENFGTVSGKIVTDYPKYTIQLLSKNFTVVKEAINSKEYLFEFLQPDTYRIRILIDENQNGKWDRGDLKTKVEAEKVVFLAKEIVIKANWDIEVEPIKF
jgi:hypothetical protein